MATVQPTAPPASPTRASAAAALLKAAGIGTKAEGSGHPFQALLDAHAKKGTPHAEKAASDKAVNDKSSLEKASHEKGEKGAEKAVKDATKAKAKVEAEAAEKARGKKQETKEKSDEVPAPNPALVVPVVAAPPKAETPVLPKAEGTEKTKAVRTDSRSDVPAPVTVAAGEVAKLQALQNQPKTEKAEDKQKVFVVDRRSEKDKERVKAEKSEALQTPVNASVEVQSQAKPLEQKPSDVQVTFQTVTGKAREGFDLQSQASVPSHRDAVSFQQYLVDRGYGQLVDQARIVLKDNNAGEIRMTLFPESLGKVKVALNLSDGSLAGQIFVENQTVKDVFQSNLDGLLQAFKDGGWNELSLQVSVGGEGSAPGQQQGQGGSQARDYGRQVVQVPVAEGFGADSWTDRQINLTA